MRSTFRALIGPKIYKNQTVHFNIYDIHQYTAPSTDHLHAELKLTNITTPIITPYRPKNFKSKDFNPYQFLNYIYITRIILTEIIILIII